MPRLVSEQEFLNTMPRYVDEANRLVDAVIQRSLSESSDDFQVSARRTMRLGWETDPDKLHTLWRQRDDHEARLIFNADVAMEGLRLAVERTRWQSSSVWLYSPPMPQQEAISKDTPPDESVPEKSSVPLDWVNSKERSLPQNLISPVLSFYKRPDSDPPHRISIGLYKSINEYSSVIFGQQNITDTTTEAYQESRYPALQETDLPYLEQGVHTLHTHKIQGLLRILSLVARQ